MNFGLKNRLLKSDKLKCRINSNVLMSEWREVKIMLISNVVWAVLLYFIQPVFIVGLLYAYGNYKKRVNYSRKTFRVNFNRSTFELKDYFLKGLLPGLIISVLSVVLGVPLTIEWYVAYQGITILLMLIGGSRFIHPIFTFSMTSILFYIFEHLNFNVNFSWLQPIINENLFAANFEVNPFSALVTNGLFFASLILLFSLFTLTTKTENEIFPVLGSSKRGKTVAQYPMKSLWVLPMAVVVPGEVFEPFADWWPVFNIGSESYAFLLLPVLVGFHYTVSTQLFTEAAKHLRKEFLWLFFISMIGVMASYFYLSIIICVVVLVFIAGLFILYRHRRRENMHNYRYGPADEGLRVIAVRRDSPAERMNLSIGDIIMDMNDQSITTREEFNERVAYNRSYVKMRIRRKDGEIVITETPLYDDDYNNLGLLILENE